MKVFTFTKKVFMPLKVPFKGTKTPFGLQPQNTAIDDLGMSQITNQNQVFRDLFA